MNCNIVMPLVLEEQNNFLRFIFPSRTETIYQAMNLLQVAGKSLKLHIPN